MLPRAFLLIASTIAVVYAQYYPDNRRSQQPINENNTAVFCYINGSRIVTQLYNYQTIHFGAEKIKVDLCTHLVFGAVEVTRNGELRLISKDFGERQTGQHISIHDFVNLKNLKSSLKVIISISGDPSHFSNVARNHRQSFTNNIETFMRDYNLDGVNINWQYPSRRGGLLEDKENFVLLLRDLRRDLRTKAKLLTVVLPPHEKSLRDGYEYQQDIAADLVDYWFIMAVEYYNQLYPQIGPNAPIRFRDNMGVKKTIEDFVSVFHNVSYKLVLVVPFYGRTYQLKNPLSIGDSPMNKAKVTVHSESALLTYHDTCQKMNTEIWNRGWDSLSETPYLVKDSLVIVYEDPQSIIAKTSLALRSGLGGVMAYSLDMDDFVGDCSLNNRQSTFENTGYNNRFVRQYPLLQAMFETVERGPNSAGLRSSSLALVFFATSAILLRLFG